MIFVTVGTHEQQFNRLIRFIDNLKIKKIIDDNVIMQIGYSTYEPIACKWERFLPYKSMIEYVDRAKIVISHGGPASFFMPLQIGKVPIVVPRQFQFDEHVNNHQLEFIKEITVRGTNILPVFEIEKLLDILLNYDTLVKNMALERDSNNLHFNKELGKIVDKLLYGE